MNRQLALASPPGRKASAKTAWMVTFADLVALMLTFFVLLFSMSQIQQQKWQSIVESLASDLNATQRLETAKYAADYQVEVDVTPPGADLDYLEPILREHLASSPALAGASIDRAPDGLIISFPGARLFGDRTAELTVQGETVFSALGGVLRNLHNAIDVNASLAVDDTAATKGWEIALARSVAVTRVLTQRGFAGAIVARGRGAAPGEPFAGRGGRADGINLLVRGDRRELP